MVVYRDYDPVRRRVMRFFAVHDPMKLEEAGFVDQVVDTYAKDGEQVFARLVAQYGAEPEAETDVHEGNKPTVNSEVTGPDTARVENGGVAMASASSSEPGVALKAMTGLKASEQHASPVVVGSSDVRKRLERFYATYNPLKLEEVGFVDKMVEAYAKDGEQVFARLVAQYGSEPAVQRDSGGDVVATGSSGGAELFEATEKEPGNAAADERSIGANEGSAVQRLANAPGAREGNGVEEEEEESAKLRRRLEVFYAAYNPARLEEVGFMDKVLGAYLGKGEELFARLVEQYGPEPSTQSGANMEASASRLGGTVTAVETDDGSSESVSHEGRQSVPSTRA